MNISTGGILFTVREALPPRTHVEVIVDWPVERKGEIPLKLQLLGHVVRLQTGTVLMVAVAVARAEFIAAG